MQSSLLPPGKVGTGVVGTTWMTVVVLSLYFAPCGDGFRKGLVGAFEREQWFIITVNVGIPVRNGRF